MAPLQIILLLLLVSVPGKADLPSLNRALGHPLTAQGAWWVFGGFVAAHLIVLLGVIAAGRRASRMMHQPSSSATLIMARMDAVLARGRWATLAITGICVYFLGAPDYLHAGLAQTRILKWVPLLPETAMLAPSLLTWMAFWVVYYGPESAQRERSLPYRLGQGLPAHEMPPLGRWLTMQLRHNYYLLLPLGTAGVLEDIGERLRPVWPGAPMILGPVAIGVVFLLVPWLITRIWSTTPLRGPLRARLEAMAVQHGLKFRNILLWKTHNALTNAAILGFLPFSRYFLMTDALLETLTDRQIEAVFAHEVGHGVHRHIWWYLASMGATFLVAGGVIQIGQSWLAPHYAWMGSDGVGALAALVMSGAFLLYVFPMISHRFEHQADWFAARHMAAEAAAHPGGAQVIGATMAVQVAADGAEDVVPFFPPEPGTAEAARAGETAAVVEEEREVTAVENSAGSREAASIGAEVFASALGMIVEIANKSKAKGGWMHPSPNDRVELIRRLAVDAPAAARFDRELWWVRAAIAAVFVVGIGLSVWGARMEIPAGHGGQPVRTAMAGR